MSVRLVTITPDAEALMIYIARVSSGWQDNPDYAGLMRRCLREGHSSVFEHAHATFEIVTSRMISPQILRHWSARFQEFSQRYAEAINYVPYEARRQDTKDRQNSIDDLSEEIKAEWRQRQEVNWEHSKAHYAWALENGIAKECARAVLPLQTETRMYMTADIRTWIFYLKQRTHKSAQLEHRVIAQAIEAELAQHLPVIAEVMEWS